MIDKRLVLAIQRKLKNVSGWKGCCDCDGGKVYLSGSQDVHFLVFVFIAPAALSDFHLRNTCGPDTKVVFKTYQICGD